MNSSLKSHKILHQVFDNQLLNSVQISVASTNLAECGKYCWQTKVELNSFYFDEDEGLCRYTLHIQFINKQLIELILGV